MSLQLVLLAISSRLGFAVDETRLSPNVQKRIGELQTMRGFLDRAGAEVNLLSRSWAESRRLVLVPGLVGLLVVLVGLSVEPLMVLGGLCLGLSGFLYYSGARPVELSLARRRRELLSITAAFDGAVARASKEVARELSTPTGWPARA